MKAWDTNLLVRHLVEDDAMQLKVVRRKLELAARRGMPVWIADVTLVESFGVLRHGYGLVADVVCAIMLALTEDARFGFQSGADVRLALEPTRIKGDFPEHLISLAARRAGAVKTQTFDRAVKRFPEFEVL